MSNCFEHHKKGEIVRAKVQQPAILTKCLNQ